METYNEVTVVDQQSSETVDISTENIMQVARKADEMARALNTIMQAALKITTEKDWVLIAGVPYLQETGATKVRALFGISWKINEKPEVETFDDGHRTFTFRGTFSFKNSSIEAEGSRSSRDDFFAGKGGKKSADEVDMGNVRMAAYTNCVNNGIKRILPGLRNIDIETLQKAGLDTGKIKGYTFKTGSKGGTPQNTTDTGIVCSKCNIPVSQKVASYSQGHFDIILCMDCQKEKAAEK